jgi:uncharacterized membrane protein HdeD (DUF308 family)
MSERDFELTQFTSKPWWYTTRGVVMLLTGGLIAVMCLISPNVHMLGERFSWIPAIGVIVFLVGCLRCLDAFISKSVQGFLLNMQGGILDCIVGIIVLFSINGEPRDLVYLIAAYMLTQGLLRNVILSTVTIRNPKSNRITGIISILLGILVWIGWPSAAPWFLAFSLSIDICFRGWGLIMLASSKRIDSGVSD